MIVKRSQLVNFRRCGLKRAGTRSRARLLDIFQILPAAGVGAEHRRGERQRATNPVRLHLPQRVGDKRTPVAIAPVDWKAGPVTLEFVREAGNQLAVLLVDGSLAGEVRIM